MLLHVDGEAWIRERMLLPPDSVLTVELLAGEAIVAATAVESAPPTRFALTVDEARVVDATALRTRATLRSEAGTWSTPEPSTDLASVLLVRAADDASA